MDSSTFYALFSATCFTLLGLWWNVLQLNSAWFGDVDERRAVGGVYLTFLLPALMGLFRERSLAKYVATLLIYVLVAFIGVYPEMAKEFDMLPIQFEAILLILLVLVGHGLVWDFMVRRPPGGQHVRRTDGADR
jgi:hypothetical protein